MAHATSLALKPRGDTCRNAHKLWKHVVTDSKGNMFPFVHSLLLRAPVAICTWRIINSYFFMADGDKSVDCKDGRTRL